MISEADMTLGRDYRGIDPRGWLVSEKLDGCRAYWDGSRLWTRGGKVIEAPAWFTAGLPEGVALDGEVWACRGNLQTARLAVQHGRWARHLRLMVFDSPQAPGTWPDRMAAARKALAGARHAECVTWTTCRSRAQLRAEYFRVTQAGGEGLRLRAPAVDGYERGRTSNLLKVKSPCHLH